jgi:Leucine-rich repeat (LRR) protein
MGGTTWNQLPADQNPCETLGSPENSALLPPVQDALSELSVNSHAIKDQEAENLELLLKQAEIDEEMANAHVLMIETKQRRTIAQIDKQKADTLAAWLIDNINTGVQAFDLRGARLNATSMTPLAVAFTNSNVKTLSFIFNSISDEGVAVPAAALPPSLEALDLVGCGMTDIGGQVLLAWAERAPAMRILSIEKNHLSPELKESFNDVRLTIVVVPD